MRSVDGASGEGWEWWMGNEHASVDGYGRRKAATWAFAI